ncbi:MAG: LacI family DNA-binding transcriptional regulator [Enterocloster asparagiformis]|nr:LacI family DNA-binding transcriptional regulator [Enterocloster asparagiformis]
MGNVTIKMVAERAGVSTATVSRVINKNPSVRQETVEAVERAIKEVNFVPNLVARSLKSAQSKSIGLLVSDIANDYFMCMAKAIEEVVSNFGYDIIICSTDENKGKEYNYLQRFVSNQVDGIILNTTNLNDDYIAELSQRIPLVLIERNIQNPNFCGDYIGTNNRVGMDRLTTEFLSHGHRKIGIINSNLSVDTGMNRLKGFTDAMGRFGIEVSADYPYRYDTNLFNFNGGFSGAQHLLEQDDRPTALIAANNTLALGALSYIKENGFQVPADISFGFFGNITNSELLFVNLCHLMVNPATIGEKAARDVLSRIDSPSIRNRETIFECRLVSGDSIRPIKPGK